MHRLATAALALALCAGPAAAQNPDLAKFVGTYVGSAVEPTADPPVKRDIDIVVEPYGKSGISIRWVNVTLVDGRRDVPGVKRRADQVILAPSDNGSFFLAGEGYDPFATKRAMDPYTGDPLRWAYLDDAGLHVVSFAILEDGRYELQSYTRTLTKDGMGLGFERMIDGEVKRNITGQAVRAE